MNDLKRGLANSKNAAETIVRVLNSGHWIHGPEHEAFEKELAQYLGANFLFGVASGTDALEIALRSVGCIFGSTIISVANAGGYTSAAAARIGCKVIYCDVEPEKLVIDPILLEKMLSPEIMAVVVTHLYGNVAQVAKIKALCEKFEIKVIEDCAQAIGAFEDERRVGTIGDVGTFSFYPTKNLGCVGDGGAIATNSKEIAQKVRELRQYGWTSKYKIESPWGSNSRLDEIQAAVLRLMLPELDSLNEKRQQILIRYSESLTHSRIKLVTSTRIGNVAHLAVLLLPEGIARENFREYLLKLGIQTDIHYPILDCDQVGLPYKENLYSLDNSKSSVDRIVSIPLFPEITNKEVSEICRALKDFS